MPERELTSLLELDPDLGQLLDAERAAAARRGLRVAVRRFARGPLDVDRLAGVSPHHLGLLVIDGVLARELLVSDTVSTELLGPGDVLRPWRPRDDSTLLQHEIRWSVLAPSRMAMLDRRFGVHLAHYPEINLAIMDRLIERALRLAVMHAISQLNGVDRRLLALFWHLAERWGRMTAEGVAVPMRLSHRMLGQLIGARRPTVSSALAALAREGELVRRGDGTWLLTGAPVGVPVADVARIVPMRRGLVPAEPPGVEEETVVTGPAELEVSDINRAALREELQRLREQWEIQLETMRATYELSVRLVERNVEPNDGRDEAGGVREPA